MARYSETLTDHVMAPRNGGTIDGADLIGHAGTPGRGAFMILYLKINDAPNHGGEISHDRLRADHRVRIDAHRNDRRKTHRRMPGANGRKPDRSFRRNATG